MNRLCWLTLIVALTMTSIALAEEAGSDYPFTTVPFTAANADEESRDDPRTTLRRVLDIRDAIATVEFKKDGVTFKREAFASAPDQVMVFRFTANKPGAISFTASLNRLQSFETRADGSAGLLMTGNTASGQAGVEGMRGINSRGQGRERTTRCRTACLLPANWRSFCEP